MRTHSGNLWVAWLRGCTLTITGSFLLAACAIRFGEPSIWIVSPQDGARIASPVQLVLAADLIEIGPAGSGKMHFHVYIDGGDTACNRRDYCAVSTTTRSPDASIPMPVGKHSLHVVLAEPNHDETDITSTTTITVTHCRNEATPSTRHPLPNIALKKLATASRFLPESPPSAAVDGLPEFTWNSGNHAPQWIEIDLMSPGSIGGISLLTAQSPDGDTVHQVLGKARARDPYRLLHEFTCPTTDDQWLAYSPPRPWESVRFLRVETTASPSWIAWREIQVHRPS